MVRHCKDTFAHDKKDNLKREFYELPGKYVYMGDSPFKRLDIGGRGIKSFHAVFITAAGLKYAVLSCFCGACLGSRFSRRCPQYLYCGRWVQLGAVEKHPTFKKLRETHKRRVEAQREAAQRQKQQERAEQARVRQEQRAAARRRGRGRGRNHNVR